MHYLDEGPCEGQLILMLQGEPSWSYLCRDPITRGGDRVFRERVPGAAMPAHMTLRGGQEDSPREFAEAINALMAKTAAS